MPDKKPNFTDESENENLGKEAIKRMTNGVFLKTTLPNSSDNFNDKKFLENVDHYVKTEEFNEFITSPISK
ncbi:MAG: hypothetical protein A2068_06885 [Ignavibacteria bacterium GWB2_35_6b]|nr:MAG: hypothetical protein A2068_06885 [Ignavibacteria bacterium GWB2_35_6b]